jgi:hypothetical protein
MAHEESRLSSARVLDRNWVPLRHLSRRMAKIPRFARNDSASGDVHIRGGGKRKAVIYALHAEDAQRTYAFNIF